MTTPTPAPKRFFQTGDDPWRTQASSGLVGAVAGTLALLDFVKEIRVLHRAADRSKFFVVLEPSTVGNIGAVVNAMVQIEDAFKGQGRFDYDTISRESLALVPESAKNILPTR